MEIEIPKNLGRVEADRLISGKNIIFASDVHTSYHSQSNLTLLYIHLAQNYGLTIVSPENQPKSEHVPSGKPHIPRLLWEQHLRNKSIGSLVREPSLALLDYRSLIPFSAVYLGFGLDIIKPGSEEQLIKLDLILDYYSQLPSEDSKLALRQGNDLEAVFKKLDPTLQISLINSGGLTQENIRYHRVVEHVAAVNKAMEENQKSLALICRGVSHRENFISIAESLGVGYLVFEPEGLFVEDPQLRDFYYGKIQEAQQQLVLQEN